MSKFNFDVLKKLKKEMGGSLSEKQFYELMETIAKELGGRVYRNVIKRTPVGKVDGGTLRRGWKLSQVKPQGKGVQIDIYNDVDYAIYVEKGHRTRNHEGWVEGKFMLEKSENDIVKVVHLVIHDKLLRMLGNKF